MFFSVVLPETTPEARINWLLNTFQLSSIIIITRYIRKYSHWLMQYAGEAVGKSSLVPVPYEWIQKDPSCVVAHGLPEGVTLKKPSEYDTKTLMKILEQSHRIQFTVKRWVCEVNAWCLMFLMFLNNTLLFGITDFCLNACIRLWNQMFHIGSFHNE